ncbi:MAG: hypothetical protein OK439_04220, partial [Thaumarchaeota archaeon]|nr:hypothetical protein [Nitrososphaerota archaeon]
MSDHSSDPGEKAKSIARTSTLSSRSFNESSEAVLRDFYEVNPPFGNVAIRAQSNVTTYEVIEPT